MKRIINVGLLLTSLLGYLQWGKGQHSFLFQVERELFSKALSGAESFLHPFILIPLIGQALLLITVFQKEPNRIMSLIGLSALSLIMLMILLVGILSANPLIICSSLPFIIIGLISIKYNRKAVPH